MLFRVVWPSKFLMRRNSLSLVAPWQWFLLLWLLCGVTFCFWQLCPGEDFSAHRCPAQGSRSFLEMWIYVFHQIQEIFRSYCSCHFWCCCCPSLCLSWDSNPSLLTLSSCSLMILMVSAGLKLQTLCPSLCLRLFLFSIFFSVSSDWIISTDLPPSQLTSSTYLYPFCHYVHQAKILFQILHF